MITDRYQAVSVSASTGLMAGQPSVLGRILCTASTAGTITVFDGIDTTGAKKVDNLLLVAGSSYSMQIFMKNGIFVQLVSGTATFTIMWDA